MQNEKYVAVLLTREEILVLRELAAQLDNPMNYNLINRFGGALLQFGSPVFETAIPKLTEEETNSTQTAQKSALEIGF